MDLVRAVGHVHKGSLALELVVFRAADDYAAAELVCRSEPVLGDGGRLVGMTGCPDRVTRVRRGDVLRVRNTHVASAERHAAALASGEPVHRAFRPPYRGMMGVFQVWHAFVGGEYSRLSDAPREVLARLGRGGRKAPPPR